MERDTRQLFSRMQILDTYQFGVPLRKVQLALSHPRQALLRRWNRQYMLRSSVGPVVVLQPYIKRDSYP